MLLKEKDLITCIHIFRVEITKTIDLKQRVLSK